MVVDLYLVLQMPPMQRLHQVCRRIRQLLLKRKLLLIIDDVWGEDFDLFRLRWLAIDSQQGGAACVLTSRASGPAAWSGNYRIETMQAADAARAQRILLKNSRVCDDMAEGPLTREMDVRNYYHHVHSAACTTRPDLCLDDPADIGFHSIHVSCRRCRRPLRRRAAAMRWHSSSPPVPRNTTRRCAGRRSKRASTSGKACCAI